MKGILWTIQAFMFLIILIVAASCNGTVKKDLVRDIINESEVFSNNQQKLIRTQSLNKGDNVHCSLQDKAGNLWFGTTADGVFIYDGNLFSHFTAKDGLNSNTVWCILEDKSGKIWLGTSDGVCLYDDDKFTKVQIVVSNDTLNDKFDVWSIMQDESGKLWFATGIGVYVYDGQSFTSFIVTESENDCYFKVEYILEDKAGNFWFGGRCNPGVYRYDGKSITNLRPEDDHWAWPVLQDKKGNIWFSNWSGAYRYDGTSFASFTKNNGLAGVVVTRIIEDKKGNLWFGGEGGISLFDGKSFAVLPTKDALSNNDVWTILEDNTGNIWVGTRETGLYQYDGKRFSKFSE